MVIAYEMTIRGTYAINGVGDLDPVTVEESLEAEREDILTDPVDFLNFFAHIEAADVDVKLAAVKED